MLPVQILNTFSVNKLQWCGFKQTVTVCTHSDKMFNLDVAFDIDPAHAVTILQFAQLSEV